MQLMALSALLAAPPLFADCDSGTAFLVRHAEKVVTGDSEKDRDAPLSDAGRERAEKLAATLADAGIDAVYSSPYERTRHTADPLAGKLGLEVEVYQVAEKDASAKLVAKVEADQCGHEVLIVGHSNTVPELLQAFGATAVPEIADSQYDQLFLVHWRKNAAAQLITLHYGRPTP